MFHNYEHNHLLKSIFHCGNLLDEKQKDIIDVFDFMTGMYVINLLYYLYIYCLSCATQPCLY